VTASSSATAATSWSWSAGATSRPAPIPVRAMAEALGRTPPASAKTADLGRHPGMQKSRTLEEMAGRRPKSADAPRFATGDKNW